MDDSCSQTLIFTDEIENELLGADSQATQFEFRDFGVSFKNKSQEKNEAISKELANCDLEQACGSSALEVKSSKDLVFVEDESVIDSCSYCEISDPATLAKCVNCNKWFCNGRRRTSGSHIVNHLVYAKHTVVGVHRKSQFSDMIFACHICNANNVFMLGFVPTITGSTIIIVCRQPCGLRNNSKDDVWDWDKWQALIVDHAFQPWLINFPSERQQFNARQITAAEIYRLETDWTDNQGVMLGDLNKKIVDFPILPVALRYENGLIYQNTFGPLVHLEAQYDKMLKESLKQDNIIVRWDLDPHRKIIAYFQLTKNVGEMKIAQGDELRLLTIGNNNITWSAVGNVIKIPNSVSDEIGIEINARPNVPTGDTMNFSVEFIWKSTSFDRMRNALQKFAKQECAISNYIYSRILGKSQYDHYGGKDSIYCPKMPKCLNAPHLPELNRSQSYAVKHTLQRPLSLIQGPPGTGKTVTSATIVYFMAKLHGGPILVCAPSNTAVDQLTNKIHQTGLRVVRLYAKSREAIENSVSFLALHKQIQNMPDNEELKQLQKLQNEAGNLGWENAKRYRLLKKNAEYTLLDAAEVICCTCVGAGDRRIRNINFSGILIDESMQATEPECMVPIVFGAKHLVLVGDHCQLGPVVVCKEAGRAGLAQSLFERLVTLGNQPFRLEVQYRMHPELCQFPSNFFYEGSLQNGVTVQQRSIKIDFPWPQKDKPMLFLVSQGHEEISGSGTSYLNRMEASCVEQIATRFLKCGIKPEQIGIITPYQGQRAYMSLFMQCKGTLHKNLYQEIEIASVDAFQGREKDLIIMSCVRSNVHQGVGFLKDPRRLNVALTRARFGLIIIGNAKILSRQPIWNHLLTFYKERRLLVEGSLNNLRQSPIRLQRFGNFIKNPNSGARFMSARTDDTSHLIAPGSYCRQSVQEDVIHSITEGQQSSVLNDALVPVGMFLKLINSPPPKFNNQFQDIIQASKMGHPENSPSDDPNNSNKPDSAGDETTTTGDILFLTQSASQLTLDLP